MLKTLVVAGAAGCIVLAVSPITPRAAWAQQEEAPAAKPVGPETIESIDRDYARELARLERQRLERLARLAAGQPKEQAQATYEAYLRLAIAGGLFREAEPTAERVLRSANPASPAAWLAAIVNIVAEADRGAHEESLQSLAAVIQGRGREAGQATGPGGPL